MESEGVNQGHILSPPSVSILKESVMLTGDLLVFLWRVKRGGSDGEKA